MSADPPIQRLNDKDMRWIIGILCAILGVFGFVIYILIHLVLAVML